MNVVSLAILLVSAERGEAMEGVEVALHQGTVGAQAMDEGVTVLVGAPPDVAVTRPDPPLDVAVTHPAVPLYVAVTHLEVTATAGLHIVGEMSCHMLTEMGSPGAGAKLGLVISTRYI